MAQQELHLYLNRLDTIYGSMYKKRRKPSIQSPVSSIQHLMFKAQNSQFSFSESARVSLAIYLFPQSDVSENLEFDSGID